MKVRNWNPRRYDIDIANASMAKLRQAAEVVAEEARSRCPVGTISRPVYRSGPYAGLAWTARDAGALKRTIRVVEKHQAFGEQLFESRNVRIYAGNREVYYARIVEYAGKKFLRPALGASNGAIKSILG